jgi:hypothetical protein
MLHGAVAAAGSARCPPEDSASEASRAQGRNPKATCSCAAPADPSEIGVKGRCELSALPCPAAGKSVRGGSLGNACAPRRKVGLAAFRPIFVAREPKAMETEGVFPECAVRPAKPEGSKIYQTNRFVRACTLHSRAPRRRPRVAQDQQATELETIIPSCFCINKTQR